MDKRKVKKGGSYAPTNTVGAGIQNYHGASQTRVQKKVDVT
jgi:hypothetical protein